MGDLVWDVSIPQDALRRWRISRNRNFAKSALQKFLPHLDVENRQNAPIGSAGFVVLPKRWIVERSIAWLNRWPTARQGLGEPQQKGARVLCASHQSRLMLRKLCNSGLNSPDRLLELAEVDVVVFDRCARHACG